MLNFITSKRLLKFFLYEKLYSWLKFFIGLWVSELEGIDDE